MGDLSWLEYAIGKEWALEVVWELHGSRMVFGDRYLKLSLFYRNCDADLLFGSLSSRVI